MNKNDPKRGEVLVAIMNNQADFKIACDHHWYRIPVDKADKWLREKWPPEWLAFYQTKAFGAYAYSINDYARVFKIRKARRRQLFPDRPQDKKSDKMYYQLVLEPLKQLAQPIISQKRRRIVFIPTTWEKFVSAAEINDLYHGNPLEDRLWAELQRLKIKAERQEFVRVNGQGYFLDFAVHCARGNLDIETDGDRWHHNPRIAVLDNLRDNNLVDSGWHILRFTGLQIRRQMQNYCLPKIIRKIKNLRGAVYS